MVWMPSGQSLERKIAQNKGVFMKKVVIITSSLRPNSNSDLLAESFKQGVLEAGHEVELISLKSKKLDFCVVVVWRAKNLVDVLFKMMLI